MARIGHVPNMMPTHHDVYRASIPPAGPQHEGHSFRLVEVVAPAYHSRRPFSLALNVHFAFPHA